MPTMVEVSVVVGVELRMFDKFKVIISSNIVPMYTISQLNIFLGHSITTFMWGS